MPGQTPAAYYAPVMPVPTHLPPPDADQDGIPDTDEADAGPAVPPAELARIAQAKALEEREHADRAAALAEQARRVSCASTPGATCPPRPAPVTLPMPTGVVLRAEPTDLGEVLRGVVGAAK
jgi:hypothetical protein